MSAILALLAPATGAERSVPLAEPLLPYAFYDIDLAVDSNGIAGLASEPRRDVAGRCRILGRGDFPVRLHLKGRATFESIGERPSFTVKGVPAGAVPGEVFAGKFHLHNSNQDESLLRDMISRAIFRQAGLCTPALAYARVRLNNRTLGYYTASEGVSRRFLKRAYGCPEGRLWEGEMRECDQSFVSALGEELHGWEARAYEAEDLTKFIAADYLASQGDGYTCARNNYWVYWPGGESRLRLFPHTMDYGFRGTAATLPVFAQAAREFLGDAGSRDNVLRLIAAQMAASQRQRVLETLAAHGRALIEDMARRDPGLVHPRCKAFGAFSEVLTHHYEDLACALAIEARRQDCSMSFSKAGRWQAPGGASHAGAGPPWSRGRDGILSVRTPLPAGTNPCLVVECPVLVRAGRWRFEVRMQCVPSEQGRPAAVVWLGAGRPGEDAAGAPCDLSGAWRNAAHEFVVERASPRQLFPVQEIRLRVLAGDWQGQVRLDLRQASLRRIGD